MLRSLPSRGLYHQVTLLTFSLFSFFEQIVIIYIYEYMRKINIKFSVHLSHVLIY